MGNTKPISVFNATEPLRINDQASITRAQVLFLYAVAAAAADVPVIVRLDEGPLPFTGVDEAAPRYGDVRTWLGMFLDANLAFRVMMPIPDGGRVTEEIKKMSHECTDAGLLEFHADDDSLRFTALGVEAITLYGWVFENEWRTIESVVLKIVNDRYGHCGIGVEACTEHVTTLNPRDLTGQFVLVDTDLMAATYRRTDGMLVANVFGVGTFIVERLCAVNTSLLAALADEGMTERNTTDEILDEYHRRFKAASEAYQREHGIVNDPEPDEAPQDGTMAQLAAALGKALGHGVGLKRVDIPRDGGEPTVKDLDEKVADAEAVIKASDKPVS